MMISFENIQNGDCAGLEDEFCHFLLWVCILSLFIHYKVIFVGRPESILFASTISPFEQGMVHMYWRDECHSLCLH